MLGVVITFFTTVETGIYVSVGFSLFILLARIARPRFSVLGRVPIYHMDNNPSEEDKEKDENIARYVYVSVEKASVKSRNAFKPMPPGVVVVRLGTPLPLLSLPFLHISALYSQNDCE